MRAPGVRAWLTTFERGPCATPFQPVCQSAAYTNMCAVPRVAVSLCACDAASQVCIAFVLQHLALRPVVRGTERSIVRRLGPTNRSANADDRRGLPATELSARSIPLHQCRDFAWPVQGAWWSSCARASVRACERESEAAQCVVFAEPPASCYGRPSMQTSDPPAADPPLPPPGEPPSCGVVGWGSVMKLGLHMAADDILCIPSCLAHASA